MEPTLKPTWNHLEAPWNQPGATWNHRVLRTQWRSPLERRRVSRANLTLHERAALSTDQLKLDRSACDAIAWHSAAERSARAIQPRTSASLGPGSPASHSCGHRRPHRPLSVRVIDSPGLALELRGTAALEVVTTTTATTLAALIEHRNRGVSVRHVLYRGWIRTGGGAAAGSRSRASVLLHVHTQPDAAEQHETRPQVPTTTAWRHGRRRGNG